MNSLPTFVIAGAMRSGTTSLNGYLREHPDIVMSQPKEVHFFDVHYDKGLDWYSGHFDGAEAATAVGEATPDYLFDPQAPGRIAATLPGAKILVMLRDPVDRAYSHYWHNVARDKERLTFAEAVAAEPSRLAAGPESRAIYSYAERGRYLPQLRRLLDAFPDDRVLIQSFDELEDRPQAIYARTLAFLGVDTGFVPESLGRPINSYVRFRSTRVRTAAKRLPPQLRSVVGRLNQVRTEPYPEMPTEVRRRLADDFGAFNEGIADLLTGAIPTWARKG